MKDTESTMLIISAFIRIIVVVGMFFCIAYPATADSEMVTFEGKTIMGKSITLKGILTKPDGKGPFPAVVLLHGCGGIFPERDGVWVSRFVNWDYVTLQVDSLGPRGKTYICDDVNSVTPEYDRMLDAYAGKSYLEKQIYVDENRIALMGWSHGGWTTLYAVDNLYLSRINANPFKAAIAFYPRCVGRLFELKMPLLILIGEIDDWAPAHRCKDMKLGPNTPYEFTLKVYPGAYHDFDVEGLDEKVEGHKLKYDPVAAKDAIIQVKSFLEKHLQ